MMRFQFHIIGRTDDISHLETKDLSSHPQFPFCLKTKVSWSKNVMEERECPPQILIGANDSAFCLLLSLGCYIESRLTEGLQSRFLFGESDHDDEPQRVNHYYQRRIRAAWTNPEFVLMHQQNGTDKIGTHSLQKFPSTWAKRNGCRDDDIEIRGRWKGKRRGRIVNRYISLEQLPIDAKVAGILCVGGPIRYRIKDDAHISDHFMKTHVVPNTFDHYQEDRSNHIAVVLGPALLYACFYTRHGTSNRSVSLSSNS
jgi:hypothetical protein